jgi:hypothetical protein
MLKIHLILANGATQSVLPKLESCQYPVCHYEKNQSSPEAKYDNINETFVCVNLVRYIAD